MEEVEEITNLDTLATMLRSNMILSAEKMAHATALLKQAGRLREDAKVYEEKVKVIEARIRKVAVGIASTYSNQYEFYDEARKLTYP